MTKREVAPLIEAHDHAVLASSGGLNSWMVDIEAAASEDRRGTEVNASRDTAHGVLARCR
eukprot:CAMPEP_0168486292 /NCGR_PEP_ID=MMETSP0228-20121227/67047_1 /TAXON_ID=133427 /ORGANISM="Protoceratium reticulatum, Strain CCCM 535 (=CCMP 1889)" /LENGTH=59 /DNA_ID=CAMNT_0008502877 /DNA_START=304 /DNA_END=481 /DNA_ORIENTATION=-